LVVPERDVVSITEALADSGIFHVVNSSHLGSNGTSCEISEWRERAATFADLERRILAVMETLAADEGEPPSETPHLVWPEVAQIEVEKLEQEVQTPAREREEEERRLAQLERYASHLKPIADLDIDLDTLRSMRYTFVLPGTMPAANVERLRSSLEHIPSTLVTLRSRDHMATVVLFGMQRDKETLTRAARSGYLSPIRAPEEYRGTPAEAIVALEAGIERAHQHIEEFEHTIDRLREMRIRHLRHLLWRVRASRTLVEIIDGYGRLRYTYLIAGWVPIAEIDGLQYKIEQISSRVTFEVNEPEQESQAGDRWGPVPVLLKNPPFLRAFQGLVTNYGYPSYSELDPTLLLTLTFPLVFGIMFGDVGHGMVLALLGLLLASRRVGSLRRLSSMGSVILACGIMSTLFGFLYGSVFGFEDLIDPLWIRPLEDVTDILLGAIAIGVVLLSVGMVFSIINAAIARRWGHLLFAHHGLAGLVFYWSLIGLAASAFAKDLPISQALLAAVAILSGLALVFNKVLANLVEGHRPLVEGSLGTYLMKAFFELFEAVIGLLSNTLSHVRIGAFAVAHGSLSLVVFIIAEAVSPARGIGYWLVVVLGNLFVMLFEGVIVSIQTLRLEYYEFFSKFFSGTGVRFRPLRLISRGKSNAQKWSR
jgi:V/A-type H+-transporting ATPase subunit I